MKRIIYAGSEFLTGDEIAIALLRYSAALAEVGEAETVTIPALEDDGSIGSVVLLVGPASQIVAKPAGSGATELIDVGVLAELEARTRRLRPVAVVDPEPPAEMDFDRGV
ncbi:hypothetical protein [Microbacterium sp. CPCC 204701]|uniref:hypothetical protein n=1 Tax=Microbacterium sp. CPCC 204701 TaxID=2493084 RepID=UPI000FD905EE|nr:hypothetical protein [Microbacterium sp. CPCC 204701]